MCAILCDEPGAWPNLDAAASDRLFKAARREGVHLLVADRIARREGRDRCPPLLRERFAAAIRHQVAVDEFTTRELRGVLAAFAAAGIGPLVFKGAALAFSHYADSSLRPRVDTDLLLETEMIEPACAVLERLDYRRAPFVSGELVMFQVPYIKTDAHRLPHAVDLHWKIANPQVFASAFTAAELRARGVGIPALGEAARAAAPIDALALACVHRAAHHGPAVNEERLIWLYDIHVVAARLDVADQEAFVDLAKTKQLTAVCADALAASARCFRGRVAADLAARLSARGAATHEPSAVYVTGKMRKVDVLLSDLAALPGWRARIQLVREHVLPPPSYMRRTYGVSSAAVLPFYYALRFVRGARDWYRRRDKTEGRPNT